MRKCESSLTRYQTAIVAVGVPCLLGNTVPDTRRIGAAAELAGTEEHLVGKLLVVVVER